PPDGAEPRCHGGPHRHSRRPPRRLRARAGRARYVWRKRRVEPRETQTDRAALHRRSAAMSIAPAIAGLADARFLALGDAGLEYRMIGPRPDVAPTLVLLHQGLGCVDVWESFGQDLAAATGVGVFAYSRAGYGRSSPTRLPRPVSFIHDEAREVLPRVLAAI